MAKRKSSARHVSTRPVAFRGQAPERELARIEKWVEEGDHEQAVAELEKLEKRYPYDHDVLNWQLLVLQETKQYPGLLRVALRAVELTPNDAIYQYNLVLAYTFNNFIALAWRQAEGFLQHWPDDFMAEKVRELVEPLETSVKEEMAKLGVAGEEGRRLLEQHEQVQIALQRQDLVHAQELVQKIQERMPHFVAPLNNLALLQLIHGHVDEAITLEERVLEQDPDNINALSNLIHALVLSGRQEATAPLVRRLRGITASGDYLAKKLEGLAWARDDQAIVDAFSKAEAAGALKGGPSEGIVYHHAAVAAARLGNKKQARQLWRRALELSPGLSIARENLADLENPPGQRQGAWPFGVAEWLPRPWVEQLSSRLPKKKGRADQQIQRELTHYLEEYPQIVAMAPILLERGDRQARELISFLTMASGHPALQAALRDFALGRWGTDEQRMKAAQYCTEHGILQRGQLVRMWNSGQQRELILMGWEITTEPKGRVPQPAERLIRRAVEALQKNRTDEAEEALRKGLEIVPDHPSFLQNLAIVYMQRGDEKRAEALIRQIIEHHPNHLIARCNLALILTRRGEIEEARRLIEPVLNTQNLHISEFAGLCTAQIQILLKEGHRDGAQSWLQILEQVDPENYNLPALRRMVTGPAELLRYLRRMLQ